MLGITIRHCKILKKDEKLTIGVFLGGKHLFRHCNNFRILIRITSKSITIKATWVLIATILKVQWISHIYQLHVVIINENDKNYNADRSGSNVGCSNATFYFQFYSKIKRKTICVKCFLLL